MCLFVLLSVHPLTHSHTHSLNHIPDLEIAHWLLYSVCPNLQSLCSSHLLHLTLRCSQALLKHSPSSVRLLFAFTEPAFPLCVPSKHKRNLPRATGDSFSVTVSGLLHEVSQGSAILSTSRSEHEGPMLLELIMDIKRKNEEQLLTWIARFYAIAGK